MENLLSASVATGLAALLGGTIGLERQWHQGLAGLRTNALVATAASAFVRLPIAAGAGDLHPANLAGSVISGIGFLGAGVILREGMNVRGLNTAATLWCSAAVGVYTGSDLFAIACGLTAVILAINIALRPVISQLNRLSLRFSAGPPAAVQVSLDCPASDLVGVRSLIIARTHKAALQLRTMRAEPIAERPEEARLHFEVLGFGRVEQAVERLLTSLDGEANVCSFAWARTGSPDTDIALHPSA
ncbi:hypothetical protein BK022_11745 [Methylorubrum extorquens]|uniref:Protein MgtC n=1 Tax=Methylorubrum extorquens TaxID=408 RepID=A0A1S1P5Q6_METEX|nr:hypothetical protein BK022_11745 [Methylorubrum extorquens]